MIPKILHYCWFGNKPEPQSFKVLKKTWQKNCSDFCIKRWDESNFDVNQYIYTREAYRLEKYDLVSDFVRLYALKVYGGIYLDVDVEIVRPITTLLNNQSFFGLEDFDAIGSGLICGAVKQEVNIQNLLNIYQRFSAIDAKVTKNCVEITTDYFRNLGFKYRNRTQFVNGCKIYSTKYFCPGGYGHLWRDRKALRLNKKTFTIHHYKNRTIKRLIHINAGRLVRRIIGRELFNCFYHLYKQNY